MDTESSSTTLGELAAPRRRVASGRFKTLLLTLAVLGGLLGVVLLVFRGRLTPAVTVEVGRVLLLDGGVSGDPVTASEASELLFQASGWIEPAPWAVRVATLTDGFVAEVLVDEGDPVTNGQLVARLDPVDATLDLREVEAREAAARAAVQSGSNIVHAARRRQEAAQARLDGAAAWLEEAADLWRRVSALGARDIAETHRIAARRALTVAGTEKAAAEAMLAGAVASVAQAEADRQAAEASLQAVTQRRAMAAVALARTEIRAPRDGVVLRRYVEPGAKCMAAMDDPNSATIVSLFDPAHLQVRVDVPLAEAGKLEVGMPTRISTAMLPGRVFTGAVIRIVGQADLQRNTLQAKVVINAPDARLRPEVLCRVEFRRSGRADGTGHGGQGGSARHTLWVPVGALAAAPENEPAVWVVSPLDQTVQRRAIRLGSQRREGYRLVEDGLRANERVVTQGAERLSEGRRVRVRREGESR